MQGGVESYVREHYGECNGNGDVSLTTGGHNKPGTPADALSLEYVILISAFRQTPFKFRRGVSDALVGRQRSRG
eukprot:COSAG02_NODE_5761_length_4060_cov_1.687453_3_plen_74_part_00